MALRILNLLRKLQKILKILFEDSHLYSTLQFALMSAIPLISMRLSTYRLGFPFWFAEPRSSATSASHTALLSSTSVTAVLTALVSGGFVEKSSGHCLTTSQSSHIFMIKLRHPSAFFAMEARDSRMTRVAFPEQILCASDFTICISF